MIISFRRPRFLVLGLVFALLSELGVFAQTSISQPPPQATPAPVVAVPIPKDSEVLQSMGAYFQNSDPTVAFAAYKDKDGNLPRGFTAPTIGVAGPGHNAWMMVSTALVIFMTLPGLGLFYGGLVRTKNVLSVMAWCLAITSLVTVLWWAVGYSLVFGKSFNSPYLGGSEFFFLQGVGAAPNMDYAPWVSHSVFAMYQLAFAIITPAVIIGSVVERMRFNAVLLVVALWVLLVYCPLAHMVWGVNGLMNGVWYAGATIKAVDFAGGMVVEMASGFSALVLCLLVGKRHGHGKTPMPPHSLVLCVAGTGLLWVGWYGFNAGSAGAADGIAGNAFMTTTLSAAVAAGTWALFEHFMRGKASVLGFCSGAVAGLVAITPACGFVDATGAIVIGLFGGAIPFYACTKVKGWFGYDDALDVFGVHGVGGTVGLVLTGIFATTSANPNLATHLSLLVGHNLWLEQLKGIGLTFLLAITGTTFVALLARNLIGLRAPVASEHEGLDISEHGEEGYIYDIQS